MHRNSKLLFREYGLNYIAHRDRVLEIGPDCFPSTLQGQMIAFHGDWDTIDLFASPDLTYQAESEFVFPINSGSYDVVVASSVIEHVRNPFNWMREVVRVLRPRGRVIIIVPNNWIYHEAPVDCWRIFPEGMKQLFSDCGLKTEPVLSTRLLIPSVGEMLSTGCKNSWHSLKQTIKVMAGTPPDPFWTEWHALDTIAIGIRP